MTDSTTAFEARSAAPLEARLDALRGLLGTDLAVLYGPRATEALTMVLARCRRVLRRPTGAVPRRRRRWDEHDCLLITYPDHVQEPGVAPLATLRSFLRATGLHEQFPLVHVLPFSPSSSDDGFAVIDHHAVDPEFGTWDDIDALAGDVDLGMDVVLNHASASSAWFGSYRAGHEPYTRYFVEADPDTDLSAVVRPRQTPLLTAVDTSRGPRHVWTTFGPDQVDLDFRQPEVLAETVDLVLTAAAHGARIVRLDAVAFTWKEHGTTCINHPHVYRLVRVLRHVLGTMAPGVWLLTETNVPHAENVAYWKAGAHLVYNFALPPLLLDALLTGDARHLAQWLENWPEPRCGHAFVNFTASHDGVGLRPVEGLLPEARVARLVAATEARGGLVSRRATADGTDRPYELNCTYFDALGFDPREHTGNGDPRAHRRRFLASQAFAAALRGIPAVYLPSLVAATNDHAGVAATGRARSINRHKYGRVELAARTAREPVFAAYRRLLDARRAHPAFHPDAPQRVLHLGHPALVGVLRGDAGQEVLTMLNAGPDAQEVDLTRHGLAGCGTVNLGAYDVRWLPVGEHQRAKPPAAPPTEEPDRWQISSRTV